MSDLKQIGYIDKNMQGNRVYDADGISATLASQTGGQRRHGERNRRHRTQVNTVHHVRKLTNYAYGIYT
ncbi:hypothetical protein [Robertmurraya andreesenii]|uniref:Uncharacterized protein n=1 Tax=Anoxybacillus andreesenii TaxID=1325932 RepID=A0ABT9V1X1_9BACL|nr:hypothetical protein [Robertmurraya andreesenii]MDQ0154939.1 hypothetical protein [Robertmurraya andreesenii]